MCVWLPGGGGTFGGPPCGIGCCWSGAFVTGVPETDCGNIDWLDGDDDDVGGTVVGVILDVDDVGGTVVAVTGGRLGSTSSHSEDKSPELNLFVIKEELCIKFFLDIWIQSYEMRLSTAKKNGRGYASKL